MKRIEPKEGQESVWDYPRPPKLEKVSQRLIVKIGDSVIADTTHGYRVLETSHPPTYYLPPGDINFDFLKRNQAKTFCEWKGIAHYLDYQRDGDIRSSIAWYYTTPTGTFEPIKDYLSFYAHKADECFVDGQLVQAQQSTFYGGWITSNIVGPFKGDGTPAW